MFGNVTWESRIPMFGTKFEKKFPENIAFLERKKTPETFSLPLIGIQYSRKKGILSPDKKIKIPLSLPTATTLDHHSPPSTIAYNHRRPPSRHCQSQSRIFLEIYIIFLGIPVLTKCKNCKNPNNSICIPNAPKCIPGKVIPGNHISRNNISSNKIHPVYQTTPSSTIITKRYSYNYYFW